jgi:hypothetical protein
MVVLSLQQRLQSFAKKKQKKEVKAVAGVIYNDYLCSENSMPT